MKYQRKDGPKKSGCTINTLKRYNKSHGPQVSKSDDISWGVRYSMWS